ncbi:MAG: Periplasmic trehalase [Chlamydiia bacterium]|nr:Periplasmic trehalase [Chlamydiia bacterium]MCH9615746.1 Periplasmic trehalase [Chlamydiia bacterium]MCH9628851.1 Periplasmic trehalase [Chlamydiia bacterium]
MPIQDEGPLFEAVQKAEIFQDSKFFVDCIPKDDPEEIMSAFKDTDDLKAFIDEHFYVPWIIDDYIEEMWHFLCRPMSTKSLYDTLLPLPHPHVVPGGRFREAYYWDSYFTCLGLKHHPDKIKNMVDNFAYLIETYGHIPNGNRTYYLSRSQAPFFSHLITLVDHPTPYLPVLEKEYAYWMQEHRQKLGLTHYYDENDTPRPESYKEDLKLCTNHRDIRAACESGWDFSSRWMKEGKFYTTHILPIDLNCLLYHMEYTLGLDAAEARAKQINDLMWDEDTGFYYDYDIDDNKKRPCMTLAACYPLFVGIASQQQADGVAKVLEEQFLKTGGLVTTLVETHEQWDAPNGWAPLQWVAISGLKRYGHDKLADKIGQRFVNTVRTVFRLSGKIMEKYNMETGSSDVLDGEYEVQEGFGWTNGVWLHIKEQLPPETR